MKAHLRKKEETVPEKMTAQEFVNVHSIDGRILRTRDKMLFTYALIKSNDLSLMTNKEKTYFIENVCKSLATEKKPFKLILMPRSIDISGMLNMLIELKNSTSNPIRLELIRKEMDFISTFTEAEQDIKEIACYLVMWEPQHKTDKQELLKRMDTAVIELQKYNIVTTLLQQEGIAFMCNLFANPQYAHGFSGDDLISTVPKMEDGGNEEVS